VIRISRALVALSVLLPGVARGQTYETIASSRLFTGEEHFTLRVRFGVGTFSLQRDQGPALYRATLKYDRDRFKPVHEYTPSSGTLEIGVSPQERDLQLRNIKNIDQRVELAVSPRVPTSVDFQFGAGKANLDLGGLALDDASIQTGASQTRVVFSRPTTRPCSNLTIELGAADFTAEGLGNSNCSEIKVTGAAGNLVLDFTGEWQHQGVTQGDISLGFGGLTLKFPAHLGVSIAMSRFLASFDRGGFEQRGDRFYSSNYDQAAAKLDLKMQAFVGDIEILWVPR